MKTVSTEITGDHREAQDAAQGPGSHRAAGRGGNTIPFIACYRKEAISLLDDQQLGRLSELLEKLRGLEKRREEVSREFSEQAVNREA